MMGAPSIKVVEIDTGLAYPADGKFHIRVTPGFFSMVA